jgi:NADH-quinone oxidoreductase subunit F
MEILNLTRLEPVIETYKARGRSGLLPILHEAQAIYGYLPEPVVTRIAEALSVPLVDVYGVVEFYALFYDKPVGKTVIHVCNDPVCALAGSESIFKRMTQKVEINLALGEQMETLTIERAPCLGLCDHAPSLLVQEIQFEEIASSSLEDLLQGKGRIAEPIIGGDVAILTHNCGCGHTTWLEEYEQIGGYEALRKAFNQKPKEIIEEVKASGLVGRGGAAFPTGLKWESAAGVDADTKYVICNADEAEVGTFKDRVLMDDVPHRILEGLIIAAYAIGSHHGYIYIRGEYTMQYHTLQQVLEEARRAGYLGKNILGSGFDFDVIIYRGAGAYICGEETGLLDSIEGKRGFPRIKPPFPTTSGLFGKPTVMNNVETFANIPFIILNSAAEYRKFGTEKSPGSKLFCVSGDVNQPGLYEVSMGVPLRHLIEDLAGGTRDGKNFQAALIGGAAGAFATKEDLDVPLSFEGLRSAGIPLGAGAVMVFDDERDMREVIRRVAHFFAEESCGKCYPCQLGTQRQFEIMQRVSEGKALPGDVERLQDLGAAMTDASLCGLGQTASMAVLSAIKKWPEMFLP